MGIYNYKGYLDLVNSTVSNNGTYGLYGYEAADSVYNTIFIDNDVNGIRITLNLGSDSTYVLYDTISCPSTFPSQSGIIVTNNDKVRIEGCKIGSYTNSALRLDNSDAYVTDCDFTFNTNYGVYCSGSSSKVRDCRFDSVGIGLKAVLPGIPDLGHFSEGQYGNSSFLNCDSYFIHFSGPSSVIQADTLFAQQNYWGGTPPSGKFYVDDRTRKFIIYTPYWEKEPTARPGLDIPMQFSLR